MGVFVKIERWGQNEPVIETVSLCKENGIEVKIPIDLFIRMVSKNIGKGIITAYNSNTLESKLKSGVDSIVKEIKESTRKVADLIH